MEGDGIDADMKMEEAQETSGNRAWVGLQREFTHSRTEVEAVQREIRRVVQAGGGGARERVNVLIERRKVIAGAALPTAAALVKQLERIGVARELDSSSITLGMQQVEAMAKERGGAVWD
ncbi:unnamed protein product, partial [Discosporangium mesarthrocarpum]